MPFLPSITPAGKPATSSSTWAWKISPSIGESGVPDGAQAGWFGSNFAGSAAFCASAAALPANTVAATNIPRHSYATRLSMRFLGWSLNDARAARFQRGATKLAASGPCERPIRAWRAGCLFNPAVFDKDWPVDRDPSLTDDRMRGSELCTQCGLCCTGALHDRAVLDEDELGTAAGL